MPYSALAQTDRIHSPLRLTVTSAHDIRNLLASGRGPGVDWFPEGASPSQVAASMVGLANGSGGVLIVGVAPRSNRIQGVADLTAGADLLLQSALLAEPPLILPLPMTVPIDGTHVLALTVPPGLPHVYALDGRYLIRENRTNEPISARRLRQLLIQRGEVSFESDVPDDATCADLDDSRVGAYAASLASLGGESAQDLLLQRGCVVKKGRELRPTYAGLLLFGRKPQRWLPNADIAVARFPGREMGDEFVREDIRGTLPEQIQRADAFLRDHMRVNVRLNGLSREERLEYPADAVREAIVNAVAHRDYAIKGDNVRAFLFTDRLEVSSPGKLAGPVTLANIAVERFSRNAVIVQVLADMGYIERLGYGVDRMIALMRQQALRRPHFEETAGGFRVTLFGPGDAPSEGAALDLSRWATVGLNPRQEQALHYLLGHRRITNREFQDLCPDVHAETIRRDLSDLVEKGVLLKIGDKRATYYIVKE